MNRKHAFTLLFIVALGLTSCTALAPAAPTEPPVASQPSSTGSPGGDLGGVKSYLVAKSEDLEKAVAQLQAKSEAYYALARAANFDYPALWNAQEDTVIATVTEARAAWMIASPLYEQMEGIVAGTPSLADFDLNMDAGVSAAEGGDVVTFDLTLPDGRKLEKPGNLFGVTESALWGTFDDFEVNNVQADLDGDGNLEFGDALPDANVFKSGVDELAAQSRKLAVAAAAWQPTEAEAFGALIQNVPTVGDFVDSWQDSRFVAGEDGRRDFGAISRLSDILDNVTSWQTIYRGLSPAVVAVDSQSDTAIHQGLDDLKTYIGEVYGKEQGGRRYTPEDADLIRKEAQDRATAIAGQISQVAARLDIRLAE
jgi:hypothetical protein